MKLIIKNRAEDLPREWDDIVNNNPYLTRQFLSFIEKTENDYNPDYYIFYDGERADSCFVAFCNRRFDIAMFTKARLIRSVTLIYLPMSVTRSGIVLGELRNEVTETIRKMKGYKLVLNAEDGRAPGFATGYTCPKCILDLRWSCFGEYVSALRSDYRNRLKKVFARSQKLKIRFIDNEKEFGEELYRLYENVWEGSSAKIEKLSRAYFRGKFFKVFVAELDGRAVGFVQLLENGAELIFEFVGLDYRYNSQYQVYHRMLYEIIRYGIDNNFGSIDFGQTADETKLKLGCRYSYLYAWLHHSDRFINYFLKKFAHVLAYKPLKLGYRVFRGEENEGPACKAKSFETID